MPECQRCLRSAAEDGPGAPGRPQEEGSRARGSCDGRRGQRAAGRLGHRRARPDAGTHDCAPGRRRAVRGARDRRVHGVLRRKACEDNGRVRGMPRCASQLGARRGRILRIHGVRRAWGRSYLRTRLDPARAGRRNGRGGQARCRMRFDAHRRGAGWAQGGQERRPAGAAAIAPNAQCVMAFRLGVRRRPRMRTRPGGGRAPPHGPRCACRGPAGGMAAVNGAHGRRGRRGGGRDGGKPRGGSGEEGRRRQSQGMRRRTRPCGSRRAADKGAPAAESRHGGGPDGCRAKCGLPGQSPPCIDPQLRHRAPPARAHDPRAAADGAPRYPGRARGQADG